MLYCLADNACPWAVIRCPRAQAGPAADGSTANSSSIVLGRRADVALDHPSVPGLLSRKHCMLWCNSDGHAVVLDLGSTNGTFVAQSDGQRATQLPAHTPTVLQAGSTLMLGGRETVVGLQGQPVNNPFVFLACQTEPAAGQHQRPQAGELQQPSQAGELQLPALHAVTSPGRLLNQQHSPVQPAAVGALPQPAVALGGDQQQHQLSPQHEQLVLQQQQQEQYEAQQRVLQASNACNVQQVQQQVQQQQKRSNRRTRPSLSGPHGTTASADFQEQQQRGVSMPEQQQTKRQRRASSVPLITRENSEQECISLFEESPSPHAVSWGHSGAAGAAAATRAGIAAAGTVAASRVAEEREAGVAAAEGTAAAASAAGAAAAPPPPPPPAAAAESEPPLLVSGAAEAGAGLAAHATPAAATTATTAGVALLPESTPPSAAAANKRRRSLRLSSSGGKGVRKISSSHLECTICRELLVAAHTLTCGHMGCGPCLAQWLEVQARPSCPTCRAPVEGPPVRVFQFDSLISEAVCASGSEPQELATRLADWQAVKKEVTARWHTMFCSNNSKRHAHAAPAAAAAAARSGPAAAAAAAGRATAGQGARQAADAAAAEPVQLHRRDMHLLRGLQVPAAAGGRGEAPPPTRAAAAGRQTAGRTTAAAAAATNAARPRKRQHNSRRRQQQQPQQQEQAVATSAAGTGVSAGRRSARPQALGQSARVGAHGAAATLGLRQMAIDAFLP